MGRVIVAALVFLLLAVPMALADSLTGKVVKVADRGGVSSNRQVVMYSLLSRFFYSATITACFMIPLGTIIPQHVW